MAAEALPVRQLHNEVGDSLTREHLMTGEFSARIDRIEAHHIALTLAQKGGIHSHPGGVVGYVMEGEIIFEIAGQSPATLRGGDVFYEPPGATINRFDNASDTATATFIAFYPLTGDQPLISMMRQ